MTIANEIFEQLRAQGGEEKAQHLSRFFKCKPGEYGESDRFLGGTVPEVRSVSKAYKEPLARMSSCISSYFDGEIQTGA